MTASGDPGYARLLKRQQRYDRRRLVLLGLLLLAALIFSLSAGEIWLWPTRWLSEDARLFIWQLRLPRTLAVVLVGASLGMAGAVMQGIFDNPLAEPGLLGVANGAGMTLTLAVLLGGGRLPVWVLGLSAVAGALLMTLALLTFARRQASNARLLLTGVALGILCGAVMTWLIYFSSSLDLRQLLYWLMGGFSGVDWRDKWLMLSLLPFLMWLGSCGRVLNLLALGEASAQQLGLPVYFWRTSFVLAFGWMVGISVALAGAISFIGLVVPHILRLWGLNDHRALLPGCALAGGGLLLLADVVARVSLRAAEIPVGVVTATLGAPVFIWLLIRVRG
ncbi:vitamin B12 ABC transporter permease BtuC [Sodalis endosymbiont of Spalangia cameroni]|uniref:vitamin B12 ABC transporter permease BtuC n=1 Tax=Sodalis praecaptivus TaxID=1239307 RepID=UPI0031F9266F